MRRRFCFSSTFVVVCLWTALGCAQSAPSASQSGCGATNLGLEKAALKQYEASGQYSRDLKAAVDTAKSYLAQQAGRTGKLAMVLDVDETSLSNWPMLKADDFGFFDNGPCNPSGDGTVQAPCGWDKWVDLEMAPPIAPTVELYDQARKMGIKVFFITSRTDDERTATAANLRKAGYEGWQDSDLITKPNGMHVKSAADYKTPHRKEIENEGYIIVLSMGDQESDLAGGYAEKTFKLPNPFYFLP
jgi:acid phosphatase